MRENKITKTKNAYYSKLTVQWCIVYNPRNNHYSFYIVLHALRLKVEKNKTWKNNHQQWKVATKEEEEELHTDFPDTQTKLKVGTF